MFNALSFSALYTQYGNNKRQKSDREKPRERVHQRQNSTATMYTRYIWCKRTQAGSITTTAQVYVKTSGVCFLSITRDTSIMQTTRKKWNNKINNNRKRPPAGMSRIHTQSHTSLLYNEWNKFDQNERTHGFAVYFLPISVSSFTHYIYFFFVA